MSTVEAEVREGKVSLKYVKNGKEGWCPVVRRRRKKRTSKSGDGTCELDVDGEREVEYICLKREIPGI